MTGQAMHEAMGKGDPLARFRVFESEDPEETIAYLCSRFGQHQISLRSAGFLGSTHSRGFLGDMRINAMHHHCAFDMTGVLRRDAFILGLVLDGFCSFRGGKRDSDMAKAGDVIILNPGEELAATSSQNYFNLVFEIPKDSLSKTLATEMDGPLPDELVFESSRVSNPLLARFLLHCCAEMKGGLEERWAAVGSSYARTVNTLLLDGLPHSLTGWMKRQPHSTAAPYYVCRAEEFIRAHSADRLTLDDIARAADISSRSLHSSFRRFRGQTPMNYLKMVRLERAHKQLSVCTDRRRTVTEIAFAEGFSHMSKFCDDYRNRFGKLPSETLRAARP